MAQVTAMAQIQTDKLVARLKTCHKYGHVCLCAAVGLDIGIFCAEESFHSFAGKLLYLINNLTAAVVAFAGVAFGIFVGEARTHSAHYFVADIVL